MRGPCVERGLFFFTLHLSLTPWVSARGVSAPLRGLVGRGAPRGGTRPTGSRPRFSRAARAPPSRPLKYGRSRAALSLCASSIAFCLDILRNGPDGRSLPLPLRGLAGEE